MEMISPRLACMRFLTCVVVSGSAWTAGLLIYHVVSEEFEALCLRLCCILGIRSVVEQPVGSRFFRHPDVQAHCHHVVLVISDVARQDFCVVNH